MRPDLLVRDAVLTGRTSVLETWFQTYTSADRADADARLDQVGCLALADRPLSTCSQGERARVYLARALFGHRELLLFDEPAAGLSPAERRELVTLLASLPPHMSYLLIEHDLEIAMRAATRVTVMHNGRVLKSGTPDEIENDAQVQAIYMGGKH